MVDVEALAERAVSEGWSWGELAEQLLWQAPALDPARTVATLRRVGEKRADLGPVGAMRAALQAALGVAKVACAVQPTPARAAPSFRLPGA
jgi:hypothetical protein